jgi:lipopolysaccharide transport system permease protein
MQPVADRPGLAVMVPAAAPAAHDDIHAWHRIPGLFGEMWRYRELLYFLAWRDMKVRYKQAVLGITWAVIQPVFTMVVFTLLFGKLAKLPSDGLPGPVFYLAALVPWTYFSTTVATTSMSLVANADMLTKIYFPRLLLPASSALGNLVDFLIGTVILILVTSFYGVPFSRAAVIWPLLMVPLFVLTLSVGMVLAALNVKYRDIRYVVPFGIQLCLFATPIIYPVSMVPERLQPLLILNPLSGLIEAFRYALNPAMAIDWTRIGESLVAIAVLFLFAVIFFRKHERAFADFV